MPHFTRNIDDKGPILNVQLSISASRQSALNEKNQPIPSPFVGIGLVDTGASFTSVDESVVQSLSLSATGEVEYVTPSTGPNPVVANLYDVALAIYSHSSETAPLRVDPLPVGEVKLLYQGIHVLIGRDILSYCTLIYNGSVGFYTLAF